MRVTFLLGSGICVDAAMPSVTEISEQIFSGAGVVRHSDATYYIAGEGAANYDYYRVAAEPAIAFTQRLRDLADRYFADYIDGRAANYEDVANLAKQISDALSGEYENPGLLPLLVDLHKEVADPSELMERASETRDYIRDTVWRMLSQRVEGVDHLQAVVDGCQAIGQTDLFELNHDRVLEKALADGGIGVSDGFTRSMGDVFLWADHFERPVRHFKLHGSITWFHRTLPEEPWRGWVVARSTTNDPYHERGAAGELLEFPADGRPVLLTGTFDKPLAYDSTVYADQHYRFHESLRKTDAVVVLGYGFRDKAINARLIGWLHGAPNRRMIVGHGDTEALVHGARFAIAGKWNRWIHDGRLRVIDKWIAETSWDDIDDVLAAHA